MDTIEELRQQYYQAISLLQNEEDIIECLPAIEFDNCIELLDGLITKLSEDLNELQQNINQEDDREIKELLTEEANQVERKIKLCEERKTLALQLQDYEEIEERNDTEKNIIFATSKPNNTYLESDLKDIPEEYLNKVLECLKQIKDNNSIVNTQKERKLSNNKQVKDIREAKLFKIRVYYKLLDGNTAFVMGALYKKDDNPSSVLNAIINRKLNTIKEYKAIKEKIKNIDNKCDLIEKHEVQLEKITEIINNKSRGKKHG